MAGCDTKFGHCHRHLLKAWHLLFKKKILPDTNCIFKRTFTWTLPEILPCKGSFALTNLLLKMSALLGRWGGINYSCLVWISSFRLLSTSSLTHTKETGRLDILIVGRWWAWIQSRRRTGPGEGTTEGDRGLYRAVGYSETPGDAGYAVEERYIRGGMRGNYMYFNVFLGWLYSSKYEKKLIFVLMLILSDFLLPGLRFQLELYSFNELLWLWWASLGI